MGGFNVHIHVGRVQIRRSEKPVVESFTISVDGRIGPSSMSYVKVSV